MLVINEITLFDVFLSIFYSVIIILLLVTFKSSIKQPAQKYFVPFFIYKIITTVAFVLIHVFYYKGGDTFLYFEGAKFFSTLTQSDPLLVFQRLVSSRMELYNLPTIDNYYILQHLGAADSMFMAKFTSFFCLLGFNQYLTSSILFTTFCSIGIWQIFAILTKLYPTLVKYFAFGTLFFPTVAIWSSGILKDPLTLGCIGIIFYAVYQILKVKKVIISSILIVISIFFCLILKPYILYIFIPTMLLWSYGNLISGINSNFIKILITPFIILSFAIGGYLVMKEVSADAGKYSLDNIENVARGFHSWHNYLAETRDQSGYTLGEISYTPLGILSKAPESIFVTYFRPIPFIETRNIATLFEGVQSFVLLVITLYIIARVGLLSTLKVILKNNDVRSFLIFAIVFGFAVGFTSYNFGALSRYKIPALPFYTAALAIIIYESKKLKLKAAYKL